MQAKRVTLIEQLELGFGGGERGGERGGIGPERVSAEPDALHHSGGRCARHRSLGGDRLRLGQT
jgi:hypothetical protein